MATRTQVRLQPVSREDVERIGQWLDDPEVAASWYGRDEAGASIHIGYQPHKMANAPPEDWADAFLSPNRRVLSIYASDEGHVGELQIELEDPLRNAQVFILIGRKDLWHRGFGSTALAQALDMIFGELDMHRAWADVPEYNKPALGMCEQLGFALEGRLRGTRFKDGQWYDSVVMGMLAEEYTRRKASGRVPK